MKYKSKPVNTSESLSGNHQEKVDVAEFHNRRLANENNIEAKKVALNRPVGNYEYEQLVAEEAGFNTRPMIEEGAYFLAQRRGFAPGGELSDWLQAEACVEGFLRKSIVVERRKDGAEDRRSVNLMKR